MEFGVTFFMAMYFSALHINTADQNLGQEHEREADSSREIIRRDTIHFNRKKDSVEEDKHDKHLDQYEVEYDYSYNTGNKNEPMDDEEDLQILKLKCFPKNQAEDEFAIQSNFKSGNSGVQRRSEDSPCTCFQVRCDCSNLGLTDVPQNLSTSITTLLLRNNSISDLGNGSFQNYTQLQRLDISDNQINRLGKDAFVGLSQLNYLDLKNNSLEMQRETFAQGVFTPLESLTVLKLNKNTKSGSKGSYVYPDEAFSDLRNLTDLHMDGLPRTGFGPGFNSMTSLRLLVLSGLDGGFCKMGPLSNDTFRNVPQLTFLNVSDCSILLNDSGTDVLKPLQNLEGLDVTLNLKLGLNHLADLLRPLYDSNLTCLTMTSINNRYSTGEVVTSSFVSSLPRKLELLVARENALEMIQAGAIEQLPPDLKYIDLGDNRFTFSTSFKELPLLKSLKYLTLNSIGYIFRVPKGYPSPPEKAFQLPWSGTCEESDDCFDTKRFELFLPPNLRMLDMSVMDLKYVLSDLFINANNSLQKLILDDNDFPSLEGPITGLESLTELHLKHTSVTSIEKAFFQNFDSLQKLFLQRNRLGAFFENSGESNPIFEDLKNLTTLDLSSNRLTRLPVNFFQGLTNLERLYLNLNEIWLLNATVSHLRKLKILEMSHTQQNFLTPELRKHIDQLCPKAPCDLRVDLSLNPIRCDCNNFEFLKWMAHSGAFDKTFENYMCLYPDSSYKTIHDAYEDALVTLTLQCTDNYPIFLAALVVTICFLLIVVGALVYRFRWNLRYLYYAAYLRFRNTEKRAGSGNFQFDIFLSYSSIDEEFVVNEVIKELEERGLKVHVHGRDFVAGDYIAANIVTAIKKSRKTLVVLTRNLLDSTWCNYELQMANMESVHTGRQLLVFLLMDSIPSCDLGTDLLYHIRNNTYMLYPQSEEGQDGGMIQTFWDRFASDLRQ